jgi:hypothetical protein
MTGNTSSNWYPLYCGNTIAHSVNTPLQNSANIFCNIHSAADMLFAAFMRTSGESRVNMS